MNGQLHFYRYRFWVSFLQLMNLIYELQHDKTNKMTHAPSEDSDQLEHRSAQSDQSSLSAWRNHGSLASHWAHNEDSDQTGQMQVSLLVLSCCSSYFIVVSVTIWHHYHNYSLTAWGWLLSWTVKFCVNIDNTEVWANSADPDQTTPENLSTLFAILPASFGWWMRQFFLCPFQHYVISGWWKGEHERLCAMKPRLGTAGFEPATQWSEVGSANRSTTQPLLIF